MHYTLHQLDVFLKVVQHKSITRAAEILHMTQPAVSIQLKNFQEQFDIPLTGIRGRQIYITDFGMEVAEMAERILNEVQAINYKTLAYKGILSGRLTISTASTGKYVLPAFISGFIQQNPGIDLTLDVGNKVNVVDTLKKHEVEFALLSMIPDNFAVESEVLVQNKLYLVGGKDAPNTPPPLNQVPMIYREEGSATRLEMERFLKQSGLHTRKRLELTSNEAVKQAIIAGLGYSILPLIGLHNELANHEIKIIPYPGLPLTSEWRLVWLKNKKLSPVGKAFIEYIRSEKDAIMQRHFSWYNEDVSVWE
jgi:DNA-binding transcriptional LysR family regulator